MWQNDINETIGELVQFVTAKSSKVANWGAHTFADLKLCDRLLGQTASNGLTGNLTNGKSDGFGVAIIFAFFTGTRGDDNLL